jgi:hypothetical protein
MTDGAQLMLWLLAALVVGSSLVVLYDEIMHPQGRSDLD